MAKTTTASIEKKSSAHKSRTRADTLLRASKQPKARKFETPIVVPLTKVITLIGPSERSQPLSGDSKVRKRRKKKELKGDSPHFPRKSGARKTRLQQDATVPTSRASERSEVDTPISTSSSGALCMFEADGFLGSRNTSRACSPVNAILDPFNCSADILSEASMVASLEELNYIIDNMISNMCHRFNSKMRERRFKRRPSLNNGLDLSEVGPMERVYLLLLPSGVHENPDRDLMLDALLHDKMCTLIHEAFFDGETIYGVDPQTRDILEELYSNIHKQASWRVAQRWRSISISAAFDKLGESVIEPLNVTILGALALILYFSHPCKSLSYRKLISEITSEAKDTLHDIICKAQRFSLQIQKDLVSCRMKVTVAPRERHGLRNYRSFDHAAATGVWDADMPPEQGDIVLGTFKFGLEQTSEMETKDIILPEVITAALLRHCDGTDIPV
ncbi:hypothetical protein GALMADRAFT_252432 [Galerina marginata CBS 339.88]|uniref:Uncharacterized protein n=1 Tax=Galerina marginata (strain CBS 339.88) TaxID=685588 RepID=A0A067SZC9_GALM3|nr:hypothetical protein GALMADRAFT_252432 [Galerina marginata CBS 339.88]